MTVKILRSCAGNMFSFFEGQIVERTPHNAEVIDSLLRHGGAEPVEEPKKKVESGGGSVEDTDVLHDLPPKPRSRKRIDKTDGRLL